MIFDDIPFIDSEKGRHFVYLNRLYLMDSGGIFLYKEKEKEERAASEGKKGRLCFRILKSLPAEINGVPKVLVLSKMCEEGTITPDELIKVIKSIFE